MFMAIQAEKEFNFRLNMRIVPYGFFYDRINKFQSAVCVVFGRPIKLKDLTEIPDDFLAESESDQHTVEKKIMFNGKKRLQKDIEELIISIPDKNLVDLIDDATQLYVLSPIKYMGRYNNVSEKYRLSKVLSDSIQGANQTEEGRERLSDLKRKIGEYRSNLKRAGLRDAVVRREHTGAEIGYHIRVFLKGILLSPLIGYGWLANLIPRLVGRFMRYKVIEVQRRPKVDGDESAIIGATVSALILYPVISVLLYYFLAFGGGLQSLLQLLQEYGPITSGVLGFAEEYSRLTSGLLAAVNFYLMARLWRFSLYHGSEFRSAAYWLYDSLGELFSSRAVRKLREQRYEIIDALDFLIGDYY
ncbi:MAG: hypothetical protein KDK34_22625, partial [Leptospiraceae bacterium]|nr:hypothetical protein [Leptospiraceae bacterium]